MLVFHSAQCLAKISEVFTFCKAGKLRSVVQTNIDQPSGARSTQLREEGARRSLRKSDRKYFHLSYTLLLRSNAAEKTLTFYPKGLL